MPNPRTAQGVVFIAASLDGFIARADDDIDWLTPFSSGEDDTGYAAFVESVDGLIMGRRTYEKTLTFGDWPHSRPVVVMSRSGEPITPPDGADVRLSRAAPAELLAQLAGEGWKRAYIDGGQIIQAFLKAGLISEMTITRAPILLGGGRSLFAELGREFALETVQTTTFRSGLVQSRYRITDAPGA